MIQNAFYSEKYFTQQLSIHTLLTHADRAQRYGAVPSSVARVAFDSQRELMGKISMTLPMLKTLGDRQRGEKIIVADVFRQIL